MKYMIEFRLKPGQKDKALERFEQMGPTATRGWRSRERGSPHGAV